MIRFERVWSHLSMEVHYHQIEAFDVTDIDEVNRNVLRRGMLLRLYPSEVVARWKHHVHPDRFRIYFFDDLQRNPTELRRSILDFLGADPEKPASRVPADARSRGQLQKLPLTDKVRSHLAQFFQKELKTCASRLGGQPEIGQRDTVSHCYYSCGICSMTASISSPGVTGSAR